MAVRDLTGDLPVERVGAELSALAQACLGAGLLIAMREAGEGRRRSGWPCWPWASGTELSYTSDLDVLFCHEPVPGADPEVANQAADRVVRELLRGLSAVTPEGPASRSTPTCAPRGATGRCRGPSAATWPTGTAGPSRGAPGPHQGRPVAGDAELAGGSATRRRPGVHRPAGPGHGGRGAPHEGPGRVRAAPAGADPKLHLKLGPGGLADVEWTAQLLQLRVGGAAVRPGPADPGRPGRLAAAGALDAGEAAWLADAYRLCLRIRNLAYLVAGRPVDTLPTDPVALERLARAMGEPGRQRLLEDYRRATRRARRVVDVRFWDAPA